MRNSVLKCFWERFYYYAKTTDFFQIKKEGKILWRKKVMISRCTDCILVNWQVRLLREKTQYIKVLSNAKIRLNFILLNMFIKHLSYAKIVFLMGTTNIKLKVNNILHATKCCEVWWSKWETSKYLGKDFINKKKLVIRSYDRLEIQVKKRVRV